MWAWAVEGKVAACASPWAVEDKLWKAVSPLAARALALVLPV